MKTVQTLERTLPMKRPFSGIALALYALSACARTTNATTPMDASAESAPQPNIYVLDFSKVEYPARISIDDRGLRTGGNGFNFAFPIRLEQSTWVFPREFGSGPFPIAAGEDRGGCSRGSEELLEADLDALMPRGQPAWVDFVEIEFVPSEPQLYELGKDGVCFGYRDADTAGKWHWRLEQVALTAAMQNAVTKHFIVRVPVTQGPVDALKLIFGRFIDGLVPQVSFVARSVAASSDR
jgi:hypothetical protein